MNPITRLLAMTGIGLAAGIAVAGPAQAAPAAPASSVSVASVSVSSWDDHDVVGYFDSPMRCERAGRIGEIRDRWDDYDCRRVSFGFHRGDWELSVSSWGDDHDGPWSHGSWGHGPWGHDGGHHHGPFGGPFGGPGGIHLPGLPGSHGPHLLGLPG